MTRDLHQLQFFFAACCLNINTTDVVTVVAVPSVTDLLKEDSLQITSGIVWSAFLSSLHNCKWGFIFVYLYLSTTIFTFLAFTSPFIGAWLYQASSHTVVLEPRLNFFLYAFIFVSVLTFSMSLPHMHGVISFSTNSALSHFVYLTRYNVVRNPKYKNK